MNICYDLFKEQLIQTVTKRSEGIMVKEIQVTKNNGVHLHGIIMMETEQNVSPTIYLESFYKQFCVGRAIEEIAEEILCIYEKNKVYGNFDISMFVNYEEAKKGILYKLVNYERNRELMEKIPHVRFLDLAIVFYYLVEESCIGDAVILIRQEHLRAWNVDKNDVFRCAQLNTPKRLPFEIRRMSEIMRELLEREVRDNLESSVNCENMRENGMEDALVQDIIKQMEYTEQADCQSTMFVLSNKKRNLGAACILYPGILKNFGIMMGRDFYILPSSVHEVILLPIQRDFSPKQLRDIVAEVNESQVEREEFLSDHVYYYSIEQAELTICS